MKPTNTIPGQPRAIAKKLHPFIEERSRAEQMASTLPGKMKNLGLLPDPKPERPIQDQETPEQLAKRDGLKKKLRAFAS